MNAQPPTRRVPPADGGLSAIVSVALVLVAAGLVAAGVHAGLAYFTAPGSAQFAFQGCDIEDDVVRLRLLQGGPIPYRALEVTLENETADRTEVVDLPLEDDGRWLDGGLYPLGQDTEARTPGVGWDLASEGGLDNRSHYRLVVGDRDMTNQRTLGSVGFGCTSP